MRAKKHLGEEVIIGEFPSFNKKNLAKFQYSALKVPYALING